MPPSPAIHSIDITLDRTDTVLLTDSLKALLHSIFFHRVFGNIQPLTRDILEVTFPYTDDPDLESLIDSKVTSFLRYIESVPKSAPDSLTTILEDGSIKSQLSIHFFEKVTRRASWWGSRPADSEVCWEKWELNCVFLPPLAQHNTRNAEKMERRTLMEQQLILGLGKVVRLTQRTDHIPPITTNEANPFPYQIIVPGMQSQDGDGWGAGFKKILFDAASGPG